VKSLFSLALLVACAAAPTAHTAPTPAAAAGDWPQFLGPTRDGHSPEKGLVDTWPKTGPKKLWTYEVGQGYAGPVVAGGRLVLFHRLGGDEVIDCLDAARGTRHWRFRYAAPYEDDLGKGDGPRATPSLAGGKVYTLGVSGILTCVDLKGGKKLWQRDLARDYTMRKGFFGVGTSPLVEGERLLVNVGAEGAGIVAFDRHTGRELWKATDHEASYSSPIAANIDGVRMALFFTREGLVALDPATGAVRFSKRWRSRINASVNAAAPVLLPGDHLFLSASYGTGAVLLRLSRDGAKEVWKGDAMLSCHFNTPVAVGPYLFGIDGRQEGGARLRCIEWKSGKVRWTKEGIGCASLLAADGKLFALTEDGDLLLIEPNGERYVEKARAAVLNRPTRAQPALADGRLYARDGAKLVCWRVKKE
jgi:outer membrane protein assembly factor BamB